MRYFNLALSIFCLAGCAGSPPEPPTVKGEYRPINKAGYVVTASRQPSNKQYIFDFNFEGDIVASLIALKIKQPQLNVLPPRGNVTPLPVHVNLQATTLENILRVIGEQGGVIADVIYAPPYQGDQVFIKFREQAKPIADSTASN